MDFQNISTEIGLDDLQNLIDPIDSDNIEFVLQKNHTGKYIMPKPAYKYIPDWYKNTDLLLEQSKLDKTVRGCMPFMESLTFGWIIPAPIDIEIQQSEEGMVLNWTDDSFNAMGYHYLEQVGGEEFPHQDVTIIKFNLPYLIRTPKGVSTLYMPPLNRFESRFTAFSGVVDTDTYMNQINIPSIFWDSSYEGVIQAGTPIAQIIPFYRKSIVNESVKRTSTEEEDRLNKLTEENLGAVNAYYKNNVWSPQKSSRDTSRCPFSDK